MCDYVGTFPEPGTGVRCLPASAAAVRGPIESTHWWFSDSCRMDTPPSRPQSLWLLGYLVGSISVHLPIGMRILHLPRFEAEAGLPQSEKLSKYGAEAVDAVLAMAKALGTCMLPCPALALPWLCLPATGLSVLPAPLHYSTDPAGTGVPACKQLRGQCLLQARCRTRSAGMARCSSRRYRRAASLV